MALRISDYFPGQYRNRIHQEASALSMQVNQSHNKSMPGRRNIQFICSFFIAEYNNVENKTDPSTEALWLLALD